MRLGVYTARRGWVEPGQLLNTLPYQRLLQRLQDRELLISSEKRTFYLGTSGWAHRDWVGALYPHDMPPTEYRDCRMLLDLPGVT